MITPNAAGVNRRSRISLALFPKGQTGAKAAHYMGRLVRKGTVCGKAAAFKAAPADPPPAAR